MKKYSLSFKNIRDPYAFLANLVIYQALYDIRCYYNHNGTITERYAGFRALGWIKRMDKYFQLYASASNRTIEEYHQWCLHEIDNIKEEAYKRRLVAKENQQGKMGRETDTQLLSEKH